MATHFPVANRGVVKRFAAQQRVDESALRTLEMGHPELPVDMANLDYAQQLMWAPQVSLVVTLPATVHTSERNPAHVTEHCVDLRSHTSLYPQSYPGSNVVAVYLQYGREHAEELARVEQLPTKSRGGVFKHVDYCPTSPLPVLRDETTCVRLPLPLPEYLRLNIYEVDL